MRQTCVLQDGFIVGMDGVQKPNWERVQGLKSNAETALGLPDPEPEGKGHGVQRPGQQFY